MDNSNFEKIFVINIIEMFSLLPALCVFKIYYMSNAHIIICYVISIIEIIYTKCVCTKQTGR